MPSRQRARNNHSPRRRVNHAPEDDETFYCGSYSLAGADRYGTSAECFKRGFTIGFAKGVERGRLEYYHELKDLQRQRRRQQARARSPSPRRRR